MTHEKKMPNATLVLLKKENYQYAPHPVIKLHPNMCDKVLKTH
jgi:hypothetical protein